jgi:hypothetical protein
MTVHSRSIHQFYYPQLAPIIQRTAAEVLERNNRNRSLFTIAFSLQFNIRYLHLESFPEALSSHIGFLHKMGRAPKI